MSNEKQTYADYLKSLKIGYDDYDKKMNNIGFDYKEDYINKPPRTSANRNTRKGYAFNDYEDLVDLVGSEKHKDIKMKQAFMSPEAFKRWQLNPKYPKRLKWDYEKIDLDKDGKAEFVIRDGYDNIIGVNGYYMTQSKYPERYAYLESVERKGNGRPKMNFDKWKESIIGTPQEFYNSNSLTVNYKDNFEETALYKIMNKYYDIKKKFPEKVRAFKHFSKFIYPTLINIIKATIPKYTNELKDYSPEVLVKIGDCIAYPGETAVQSARYYSAQQFYAWNVFIIQPILHLNKIKAETAEEVKIVKELLQTDPIFKENHEKDDINELARSRIKSRKWFKDVVDKIYEALLQDQRSFKNLLIAMQKKFIDDYKANTGNNLLLNEDKVYALNKELRIHTELSRDKPLRKSIFKFVDNEDADNQLNSLTEEFSSQISRETSAQSSPSKSEIPASTKETPKPTTSRRINTRKGGKKTISNNINLPKEEKEDNEKHELSLDDQDEDKSEFPDSENE